jgi:hypothetical protein
MYRNVPLLATLILSSATALADDFPCPGTLTGTIPGNVIVPSGANCLLTNAIVMGNVLVEPSASLEIFLLSDIKGNVFVRSGSSLVMGESGVRGSIEAIEPTAVALGVPILLATVVGSVKITRAILVDIEAVHIEGDLDIIESRGSVQIDSRGHRSMRIFGNLRVEKTKTATGEVKVNDVRVQQNVSLVDNDVANLELLGFDTVIGGNALIAKNRLVGQNPLAAINVENNIVRQNLQFIDNRGVSAISGNRVGQNLDCYGNEPPPVVAGNIAREMTGQCRFQTELPPQ